jgi:hypothetical protein
MKNSECSIFIRYGGGVQKITREQSNWQMISQTGVLRPMTAEQVLSHMLPILAGQSKAKLQVVKNSMKGKNV